MTQLCPGKKAQALARDHTAVAGEYMERPPGGSVSCDNFSTVHGTLDAFTPNPGLCPELSSQRAMGFLALPSAAED